MKIAVIGFNKQNYLKMFLEKLDELSKKYNVIFDKFIYDNKAFHYYDKLPFQLCQDKEISEYDAAISIGGDGTFLYTARVFAGSNVPIFGVNNGQLGFNTTIEVDEFENYLKAFINKNIAFEYKNMLEITINQDKFNVLNDAVISHAGISRMIKLDLSIKNEILSKIKGDGLIISTPTGSTAYNLSAGGPILHPTVDSFVITPICPHTLAIRPFILPMDEEITVKIYGTSAQTQLTLDGHKIIFLENNQIIKIKKSEKNVRIIKGSKTFTQILNTKLGWGI